MPTTLGNITKSIFLVGPETHKMALEFTAAGVLGKLVFSADLVAQDSVNGKIGGVAMGAVTYAASHVGTMGLIVTALKAMTAVADAKISPADTSNRTIVFYLKNQATPVLSDWVVTFGGAGTAVITSTATTGAAILQGMPIVQVGNDELVMGVDAAIAFFGAAVAFRVIGVSMHYALPGQLLTVFVKGYVVTYCKLSATAVPGPAKVTGTSDVVMTPGYEFGYVTFANTAVATDQGGWLLDGGNSTDIARVLQLT